MRGRRDERERRKERGGEEKGEKTWVVFKQLTWDMFIVASHAMLMQMYHLCRRTESGQVERTSCQPS